MPITQVINDIKIIHSFIHVCIHIFYWFILLKKVINDSDDYSLCRINVVDESIIKAEYIKNFDKTICTQTV